MNRWPRISKWGWMALGVVLLAAAGVMAVVRVVHAPSLTYGAFLDEVDSGNVAAVTFRGTEIDVQLRHAIAGTPTATPSKDFTSRMPDFGDPSLIPLLRRGHVAIDVAAPSSWAWLLARVPWPMLLFIVALLVAAVLRLARGAHGASPGFPAGGPMMGLMAALAAKQRSAGSARGDEGETQDPPSRA